ncbi:M20/M25/M40 family metallo-hydrolase [Kitasatospora sp. NPDC049258]|uniref:M20 family metallopeptidase n=1 Tax=Kitasatospora sp. NPDC049258 TaxID=3155394 RepID=UPI00343F49C5
MTDLAVPAPSPAPTGTVPTLPDDPVVRLCAELIAAPSANPPGDEEPVAAVVQDRLERAGFAVRRHYARPGRPNVLATLERGEGPHLILQAHLDTKPAAPPGAEPVGWSSDPLVARIADGLLHGLGACDTKGGLAAMVVAAERLARRDDWSGRLEVQGVADEEDGSGLGAAFLLSEGLLTADAAIVSEPTGCLPSAAQLGNAWAEVTVTTTGAHAGTPSRGQDAVEVARRFMAEVDALLTRMPTDPAFPHHPRLNVGHLAAPGHPGTLSSSCVLRCDVRVLPWQRHDSVMEVYTRAASAVADACPGSALTVRPYQGGGCESHAVADDHPLVRAFDRASADRAGERCSFAGGSDARFFARAGTPAVVHGPGHLDQAHAPDEYVPVGHLVLAADQLEAVAAGFLQSVDRRRAGR